ncbi:MAG TPA: 30S ribosomal protein S16 [Bacilli bacterium]|jgi:small subunit ribosomal protein S16|nr:30S ribosomal protein S16 [Bacilli bacterium]NLT01768.1 30S ribosomal protein S16 [Acholeplasmataceae bacterium]HNZ77281.1 30S ribosomal protein S16 [Bacilli bacterium]HOD60624.1 30S ribosomal protein S16 [Bacilli bacterium]HOE07227.1 30S ribosomal protein S16 [Bacilli bacterium]
MAVKLRLQRFGAKKRPYYRVVATDSTSPRDGRFIEIIGTYHPIEKNDVIKIDEQKALEWLAKGAQPTDTVKSLFRKLGINEKFINSKK